MSHADHEWAKEHIAAHLAGGLNAEERARLEAHAATCAECIAEIDAARRFDRQMDDLFTPVRAKAGMEERIIQKLRFAPAEKQRSAGSRVLLAAAAVLLIGILGVALMTNTTETVAVQEARLPWYMALEGEKSAGAGFNAHFTLDHDARDHSGNADEIGALLKRDESKPLSVDDMVRQRFADEERRSYKGKDRDAQLDGFKRQAPAGAMAKAEELSDHFETAGKGGGAGGRQAFGLAVPAAPAVPEPAVEMPARKEFAALQQQEGQKNYSYRNNGPGQQPAEPKFFNPADSEQAKAGEAKQLLARADEKMLKDGNANKLNEVRGRQAANGQDKAGQGGNAAQGTDNQQPPQQFQRKIIRTGEVEYEIESFDTSVITITKLVEEEAGFVATVNSDKLPNGKVRGVVVLRLPPERLDTLLLKLRGLGELKSQNIRSQDVGKQYYDLESRIKAARTMETRLLEIIKSGKGEIKDLLLAEKELGEWRTKLEMYEGEKRYYDNQIGMSTLTVTLNEKEIRSASAVTETERVQMGLEVEDVEKTHKAILAAVVEAKGRVTKSELKQLAAGQFNALVHFEVTPDAAGPLRDRFRQLGNVARLDIDRVQETEGGIKVLEALKVRQKDTQVFVNIYNLANVSARETVLLSLACTDAEASYKTILARIEKAGGRVITSSLNRQKNDQTTGTLRFEIKAAEADAVLLDIRAAGEVMRLDVTENPDTQAVTKSKKGFQVSLSAMGLVEPRETTTITIASKDVPAAFRSLQEALAAAEARVATAQLNENDRQNVTAMLYFDYRRDQDGKVAAALAAAGEILNRSSVRSQDGDRTVDSKKRLNLTVINLSTIAPRETYTLAVEVEPVDGAVAAIERLTSELKGRVVDSHHTRGGNGRNISRVTIDLPLSATRGAADRIKTFGTLRIFDTVRNPQAPEGELAIGRIDISLSSPSELVDADSSPWTRIKSGLSVGLTWLSWSLTAIVVGLCFLGPIALVLWAGTKIYRKMKAKPA